MKHFRIPMLRETLRAQVAVIFFILSILCHLVWLTMSRPTFQRVHSQPGCTFFDDSEAVVRMIMKGRSTYLRNVSRTLLC